MSLGGTRRQGDGDEITNHHTQKKVRTNGEVKPGIKEIHFPVKKKKKSNNNNQKTQTESEQVMLELPEK